MLFTSDDIPKLVEPKKRKALSINTAEIYKGLIGKKHQALVEVLPNLEQNISLHFATFGMWSTHDLVLHILSIIGPASLTFATWSITEEPANLLLKALETGLITQIQALFDFRIRVRNPKTFEYLKQNLGKHCRITSCHAKVSVLRNKTWAISIVGSSNYTNNPRIEACVVSTNIDVADFHEAWILAELSNSSPFE